MSYCTVLCPDSALRLSQWENEEGFNHNYAVFKQPQQDVHGDGPREVHVEKRQGEKWNLHKTIFMILIY